MKGAEGEERLRGWNESILETCRKKTGVGWEGGRGKWGELGRGAGEGGGVGRGGGVKKGGGKFRHEGEAK